MQQIIRLKLYPSAPEDGGAELVQKSLVSNRSQPSSRGRLMQQIVRLKLYPSAPEDGGVELVQKSLVSNRSQPSS
jgi:hypothetical protein